MSELLEKILSNSNLNEAYEKVRANKGRGGVDGIQRKLGLKVNMTKTHITRPAKLKKLKYLGFGFYKDRSANEWKCRPHGDSIARLKLKLKELTCRNMPGKVRDKFKRINQTTRGWINYFAISSMKTAMTEIDAHLRTRIRNQSCYLEAMEEAA